MVKHVTSGSTWEVRVKEEDVKQEVKLTRRQVSAKNKDLNDLLRSYTSLPMYNFDFTLQGLYDGDNKAVFDRIKENMCRSQYFIDNMLDQQGNFLPGKYSWFKSLCSSRYTTLRKKYFRDQKPAKEKQADASARRVESRKARKFENRVQTWSTFGCTIAKEFSVPILEAESFIQLAYMSEEEDGEYRNGSNQARTIVVKTPSWRSIKLNQLFAKLDEVRLNNNPRTGLCKKRVHEEILQDVSPSDRRFLPSWGFK
ncbi:uncharacterized protein EV154DRAFT_600727 [Mucor mucedo]|uniref:uncharacterized protein n=1 Tax=Mucor mucedo TaxID=29922 RepID=UPI002220099E|nr:uncharacterized protein EV154DRAFT_600727 [Mucor mucedo]KAI7893676.1 hypothetical protein EV154DRAFT_600727 [Mucor mucedo]